MVWQLSKVLLSALVITGTSWLAGKQPKLAGFLIALPLSSMLALLLFQAEYHDAAKASEFAKSILVAIPVTLFFFVPFLLAPRFGFSFAFTYLSGVVLLALGYLAHAALL